MQICHVFSSKKEDYVKTLQTLTVVIELWSFQARTNLWLQDSDSADSNDRCGPSFTEKILVEDDATNAGEED